MAHRVEIVDAMRDAPFRYVTLDLEGFRSGSHNLAISLERRKTSKRQRSEPVRSSGRTRC
jgi:PP-loop superfamily ATP-utilizing enzyme